MLVVQEGYRRLRQSIEQAAVIVEETKDKSKDASVIRKIGNEMKNVMDSFSSRVKKLEDDKETD